MNEYEKELFSKLEKKMINKKVDDVVKKEHRTFFDTGDKDEDIFNTLLAGSLIIIVNTIMFFIIKYIILTYFTK